MAPYDDTRYHGRVRMFTMGKRYGFISDSSGNDYFVLGDDCRIPGGHVCVLQTGDVEVTFEVTPDPKRHEKWRATDVRLVKEDEVEIPEREEARVVSLGNMCAFAQRACGCQVFIHLPNVRSKMPRQLRVGDEVIFTAVDMNHELWDAREIDVIVPSEEQQVQ